MMVVLAALGTQAQGIRVGLTGGVNSTWLFNNNVSDANDELDMAAAFGGRLGVEAIYAFNEKMGISLGLNFLSTHNQKYTGEFNNGEEFEVTEHLKYFDVPLLFRLTSPGGTYFEIGPQFGFLGKVTEDYESPTNVFGLPYEGDEHEGSYEDMNIAVVLGFGVDIDVTERIFITTGIRLGYGLSDVTTEYGSRAELNAADFAGEISWPNYWAHFKDAGTDGSTAADFSYEQTKRVFGGLNIGVSYKFGGE